MTFIAATNWTRSSINVILHNVNYDFKDNEVFFCGFIILFNKLNKNSLRNLVNNIAKKKN